VTAFGSQPFYAAGLPAGYSLIVIGSSEEN